MNEDKDIEATTKYIAATLFSPIAELLVPSS